VTASISPDERFTPAEREALSPYVTNLDGPVFALTNLPETVKGALFARYSRSAKSLRRLFLDEFLDEAGPAAAGVSVGLRRAGALYRRVFDEYGDDSVAQLGGAHLACEDASNILTKVLEWGRLMSYLEQSTRYIAYTDRPGGRWKYHVPRELDDSPLRDRYIAVLDAAFETYARWIEPMQAHFRRRHPPAAGESEAAYRTAIRAKAFDTLRGLLPAATRSHVGIFASGQAFEALLVRMQAHPLAEVRAYGGLMLEELRKVIPAFLTRVDLPERGLRWGAYLAETRASVDGLATRLLAGTAPLARPDVSLTDFDPDGEVKVVAAALYAVSDLPDDQLLHVARGLSADERAGVLLAYTGHRANRRHRPGRAFERTSYRFDVLTDYGAFRDLQRHRLLTIEWQPLSPRHGWVLPEDAIEAGGAADWAAVMERSIALHAALSAAGLARVAPYAVAMAFRVRFYLELNAREAMHVIELRTAPQGHPSYRRLCQQMHRLIAEEAGHRAIAAAMRFADHGQVDLERLDAERQRDERRRQG
jgi:thymidylate synthase ThyX